MENASSAEEQVCSTGERVWNAFVDVVDDVMLLLGRPRRPSGLGLLGAWIALGPVQNRKQTDA
jgi:phenylalanyl-tRNA synthetase beta subunit